MGKIAQIPGLDFDPEGKKIMMMDESGVCLLSDVDTGHYIFDVKAGEGEQYGKPTVFLIIFY